MKKIFLLVFLIFVLLVIGAFSARAQLTQTQPQAGIANPFYAVTVNALTELITKTTFTTMSSVNFNTTNFYSTGTTTVTNLYAPSAQIRTFSTSTSGIVPQSDATYSTTEYLRADGTWTNPLPTRVDLYDSPTLTMVSTALTATVNVTAGQIVKFQLYTRSTYTCVNTPASTFWNAYAVAGTSTNATDFTLTMSDIYAGSTYPYVDNQGSYDLLITGSGTLQFEIDEISNGTCNPSETKYAYQILAE